MSRSLGILGTGHLAEFIVQGLDRGNFALPVHVSPRNAETAERLTKLYRVVIARNNQSLVDEAEMVLVCLPAAIGIETLAKLRFRPTQTVCSVMAGVPLEDIAAAVGPASAVVSMLPGASNALGAGACVLYPMSDQWWDVFDLLGRVMVFDTKEEFEIAASLAAASGASFVFMAHLAQWLVDRGLRQETARMIVSETFGGNAMVLMSDLENWERITASVATPGGITEDLLSRLQSADALNTWSEGLTKVLARLRSR